MRNRWAALTGLLVLAAAASCDTVDLGTAPADINACRPSEQFFYERVWPEFLGRTYGGKTCGDAPPCHGASSARVLLLPAPTSPAALPLPSDWAAIYRSASEQVRCTDVLASPLLLKPSAQVSHLGGMLIAPDGPEAALLKAWVEAK